MSTGFTRAFIDAPSCGEMCKPVLHNKDILEVVQTEALTAGDGEVFFVTLNMEAEKKT